MDLNDLIQLARFENAEVLDEIEDGFDLDQRTSRNVCEASEFLGTAATHAFGKIQNDAITDTTPLIREVAFGFRKSIDEGTRRYGKPSRMLVCLQVFENHAKRYSSAWPNHHQNPAAWSFSSQPVTRYHWRLRRPGVSILR